MAVRSKLQIRKEEEAAKEAAVFSTLKAKTRVARAREELEAAIAEEVGIRLMMLFPDKVVNNLDKFKRPRSDNIVTLRLAYALHIFGKYAVPEFIIRQFRKIPETEWEHKQFSPNSLTILKLFFACRRGESIHALVGSLLTRKETHFFLKCPADNIYQGYAYAIAEAIDPKRAVRIATSRIAMLYPATLLTKEHIEKSHRDYKQLRDLIRICIRDDASRDDIQSIVDYIGAFPTMSLKGRTVASMVAAHEEWIEEVNRVNDLELESKVWSPFPIEDQIITTRDGNVKTEWQFRQIKVAKDLAAEGSAMRHCVSSYIHACVRGTCAIISLGKRDAGCEMSFRRALTIELSSGNNIVQMRGVANRAPREDEFRVVQKWARRNNITIGQYVR